MATPTEFMSRVVSWPGPGEAGWVNLHYQFQPKDKPNLPVKEWPWTGRPFNSLVDLMGYVNWLNGKHQQMKNVFYCLSRQKYVNPTYSNGKMKVARSAETATHLKAIWLDVDVKAPPKGYADIKEALRAVLVFCKAERLPHPSALVASGGGLHAYWISDRPLSIEEWGPYAEGLKALATRHGLRCDAGLTTDPARILRVPGTFNFKETTPREVRIIDLQPADLDFTKSLSHITVAMPVTATVTKPTPALDFSHIVVSPGFKAVFDPNDSLSAGIDSFKELILNWGLVEQGCPFFHDAKATGGKDHSQSLWNLVVLATTFFENGDTVAHELSNGYPTYTVDETDKMYARKMGEREKKNLGWPSCAKIEGEGCKLCVTCPHKGKIRSPLELGKVHPTPAPHVNASTSPASTALMLPDDGRYFVDEEGYICEMISQKGRKGEGDLEMPVRLFISKLSDPWTQITPHRAINFITTEDLDNTTPVVLKNEEMATQAELVRSIVRQGVKTNVPHEGRLKEFFMSWIARLHKEIAAMKTRPFGWVFNDGERNGFSYGGTTYYRDGSTEPCSLPDPEVRKAYMPRGSEDVWFEAAKLITDQKRPHLDVMLAASFASPIMWAIGETGGTLGFVSESGANKSTASKILLSVWGHPLLTKLSPGTTERSLEDKLGTIECLPAMIDDVQASFEQVCKTVFLVTQNVSRGRLKQSTEQRELKMWDLLLLATANNSFHEYMINTKHTNNSAELVRIFEFLVPLPDHNGPGRVSLATAGPLVAKLNENFGRVGERYAKWMVVNLDYISEYCRAMVDGIAAEVGMKELERFWACAIAGVLAGAHFAEKAVGLKLDIPGMHKVLMETFHANRRRVEEANIEGHKSGTLEAALSAFLTRYHGNQLWTFNLPSGKGKPGAVQYQNTLERRETPVHAQWCVEDRLLRINRNLFVDFLNEKKYNVSSVLDGLKKLYRVQKIKVCLGGGTAWSMSQGEAIQIPIPIHHYLEPTLFSKTDAAQVPDHVKRTSEGEVTVAVTETQVEIDTGIASAANPMLAAGIAQSQLDLAKVQP